MITSILLSLTTASRIILVFQHAIPQKPNLNVRMLKYRSVLVLQINAPTIQYHTTDCHISND